MQERNHVVTVVYTNGFTDHWRKLTYDKANFIFNGKVEEEGALFVVWLEVGFEGTPDAQYVLVNRYGRDVEAWKET